VMQKVFARGQQLGVYRAREKVHVPCCDCEGEKDTLGGC
jgi:hypothetical protein